MKTNPTAHAYHIMLLERLARLVRVQRSLKATGAARGVVCTPSGVMFTRAELARLVTEGISATVRDCREAGILDAAKLAMG